MFHCLQFSEITRRANGNVSMCVTSSCSETCSPQIISHTRVDTNLLDFQTWTSCSLSSEIWGVWRDDDRSVLLCEERVWDVFRKSPLWPVMDSVSSLFKSNSYLLSRCSDAADVCLSDEIMWRAWPVNVKHCHLLLLQIPSGFYHRVIPIKRS